MLFRFEIKKIFSKRIVLLAIVLFVLLDIVKIGLLHQETIGQDTLFQAKQKILEEIRGPITKETLSFVINRQRELDALVQNASYSTQYDPDTYSGYQYGDSMLFNEFYEAMDYAYHYTQNLQKKMEKASENLELFPSGSYEARVSEKILEAYGERVITNFYDTVGYEQYIGYDFSSLCVLLLLLLVISPLFAEEAEVQMDRLLLSSPKGRYSVARAKAAVAFFMAVVVPLLFCLVDFICFSLLFSLEGGTNPLYSLKYFRDTPFDGSIFQYLLLSLLLKILGSVFFSALYLFLSSRFSHSLPSFLCSGSVLLLSIIGNDFADTPLWNMVNPILLFANDEAFSSFRQADFFGRPVSALGFQLFCLLTVSIFLGWLAVKRNRNRNRIRAACRRKQYENIL